MYIKVCEICGKTFNSTTPWRRTCGDDCRRIMSKATRERRSSQHRGTIQICEKCQRATGKCINSIVCPWASKLHIVPGWEANKIYIDDIGWSYDIIHCPIFLKDEPRKADNDLALHWEAIRNIVNQIHL